MKTYLVAVGCVARIHGVQVRDSWRHEIFACSTRHAIAMVRADAHLRGFEVCSIAARRVS